MYPWPVPTRQVPSTPFCLAGMRRYELPRDAVTDELRGEN